MEKITDSYWAFMYCRFIKDRKEVWSKIKSTIWAEEYCQIVKDRPEVRKYIK